MNREREITELRCQLSNAGLEWPDLVELLYDIIQLQTPPDLGVDLREFIARWCREDAK